MLATTRNTQKPHATVEHREGNTLSGRILTEVVVEEQHAKNIDGKDVCTGLRILVLRHEGDERVEVVLV